MLFYFLCILCLFSAPYSALALQAEESSCTFLPQWSPQAQFAGYYIAQEKGFYRAHGIDLVLMRGGPELPPIAALESGKADFATAFLATALQEHDRGAPIVNIAQIVQRSSLILVAKKSSGIKSPQDFQGKRISVWPNFDTQPKAIIRKFNLRVDVIPQHQTLNLFMRGGCDLASAMWYNEYHTLLNSGYDEEELQTFFYDDFGLNFPEDGIYCMKETLKKNPPLCRAFVNASLEGWLYAFEHPEEALDIVMQYVHEANLPTNRVHQRWMLDRMRDIIHPDGDTSVLGHLKQEEFQTVVQELLRDQMIHNAPDYQDFYENCSTESTEKKPRL